MKRTIRLIVPVLVISMALLLTSGGIVAADDEKWAEKEYDKAVKDANHGFDQLDKVDKKLSEAEPKKAITHFDKALDDFEHALTHLAKADVGKEHQGAIDDLNSGVDALNKALKNLENGNIDDAQKHYEKANEYFERAASAFD